MERAEAKRTKWGMHDEDASVLKLGPSELAGMCWEWSGKGLVNDWLN